MAKKDENDIRITNPGKRIRQISPKRQAAVEAQKQKVEKDRLERYCRLFYSDLLTLKEVATLLEVSWPIAQEMLRSTYFDIADPNKDEDRKDMEFRYADLYNKLHGK